MSLSLDDIKFVSVPRFIGRGTIAFKKFRTKPWDEQERLIAKAKVTFFDAYRSQLSLTEVHMLLRKQQNGHDSMPRASSRSVFISYSRNDQKQALQLKQSLEQAGIDTIIDMEQFGQEMSIKDYIEKFIKETDLTLCLISESSLLSGWVGFEIVTSLEKSQEMGRNRFISCALDASWKQPIHDWAKKFDQEIARLNEKLVQDLIAFPDAGEFLKHDYLRVKALRENAPQVFHHFKTYRTEDLSPANWEAGVNRILQEVQGR